MPVSCLDRFGASDRRPRVDAEWREGLWISADTCDWWGFEFIGNALWVSLKWISGMRVILEFNHILTKDWHSLSLSNSHQFELQSCVTSIKTFSISRCNLALNWFLMRMPQGRIKWPSTNQMGNRQPKEKFLTVVNIPQIHYLAHLEREKARCTTE